MLSAKNSARTVYIRILRIRTLILWLCTRQSAITGQVIWSIGDRYISSWPIITADTLLFYVPNDLSKQLSTRNIRVIASLMLKISTLIRHQNIMTKS